MRFIRLTIKYLGSSLFPLALFNLPAAVMLGIFTRPMSTLTFIPSYIQTGSHGFAEMFWLIFSRGALTRVYPAVLIFVFLLLGNCISLAFIERHLRVGKKSIKSAFKQINGYFFPVLSVIAILGALLLVYSLIQTGMLSLLHIVISGSGKPIIGNIIVSQLVAVVLYVGFVFLASATLFLVPMMMFYGFSFTDAYTAAFRLLSHNLGGAVVGLLFPTLTVTLLENAFALIAMPFAVEALISSALYLFMLVYVQPYIMVTMFDLSNMERRDLNKLY